MRMDWRLWAASRTVEMHAPGERGCKQWQAGRA